MPKIRILVIEPNRFLREAIAGLFAKQADIEIILAEDPVRGLERARENPPNIFLMDFALVYKTNLRHVRLIKSEFPQALIVAMDLTPTQTDIIEYVNAGVSGFVLRDATIDEFIHTIRLVSTGQKKVLAPLVPVTLHSLIVEHAVRNRDRHPASKATKLTARELEIALQVAKGRSNKEIASELNIAVHTVKTHIHNMLEKLSLRSRLELSNFAHTRGLTDEPGVSILRIEMLRQEED